MIRHLYEEYSESGFTENMKNLNAFIAQTSSLPVEEDSVNVKSNDEKIVGKWINGKDIYERSFQVSGTAQIILDNDMVYGTIVPINNWAHDTVINSWYKTIFESGSATKAFAKISNYAGGGLSVFLAGNIGEVTVTIQYYKI